MTKNTTQWIALAGTIVIGSMMACLCGCSPEAKVAWTKKTLIWTALGRDTLKSEEALAELCAYYGDYVDAGDVKRLSALVGHASLTVRCAAASALVRLHDLGEHYLIDALDDGRLEVRLSAAVGLLERRPAFDPDRIGPLVVPVLKTGLLDPRVPEDVRSRVAEELRGCHYEFMQPVFLEMQESDVVIVRTCGVSGYYFRSVRSEHGYQDPVDNPDSLLYGAAIRWSRTPPSGGAILQLRSDLYGKEQDVLVRTIKGIVAALDVGSIPRLVEILRGDGAPRELRGAQLAAGRAIVRLTSQDFNFNPVRTQCRDMGNGVRAQFLLEDQEDVGARHLTERRRLLEWWGRKGRDKHRERMRRVKADYAGYMREVIRWREHEFRRETAHALTEIEEIVALARQQDDNRERGRLVLEFGVECASGTVVSGGHKAGNIHIRNLSWLVDRAVRNTKFVPLPERTDTVTVRHEMTVRLPRRLFKHRTDRPHSGSIPIAEGAAIP